MTLHLTVALPEPEAMRRRAAAVTALEGCTSKPFSVRFVAGPLGVSCDAKGVGPRTLERWLKALRRATQ